VLIKLSRVDRLSLEIYEYGYAFLHWKIFGSTCCYPFFIPYINIKNMQNTKKEEKVGKSDASTTLSSDVSFICLYYLRENYP
jgi:hypothetical protein